MKVILFPTSRLLDCAVSTTCCQKYYVGPTEATRCRPSHGLLISHMQGEPRLCTVKKKIKNKKYNMQRHKVHQLDAEPHKVFI